MLKPLISIITCTKNSKKYLLECVKSVEKQEFRDFEHIFIDGYSKDGTDDILKKYTDRNRSIGIEVIKAEPKGISDAMNVGIKKAKGDIIHILHSDDYYWDEKALSKVVNYFNEYPKTAWLIGNRTMLAKGKIIRIKFNDIFKNHAGKILKILNWVPHASTFVKKSVFTKHGYFNEDLKVAMDYDYWLKIIDKEPLLLVKEDLAVFRRHKDSHSMDISNMIPLIKEYFTLNRNVKKPNFVFELKQFINGKL